MLVVAIIQEPKAPYKWIAERFARAFDQMPGVIGCLTDGNYEAITMLKPDIIVAPAHWNWLALHSINRSREVIRWVRKRDIPVVGFFWDEPWMSQAASAGVATKRKSQWLGRFFTHQALCEPTMIGKSWFPRPIFIPHAYDPELHTPYASNSRVASDILIVGRALSPRVEWIMPIYSSLRNLGRVRIYGQEWPVEVAGGGIVEGDGLVAACSARVVINIHRGIGWEQAYEPTPLEMWNERVYQYTMMGVIQVCDYRNSLAHELPEMPLANDFDHLLSWCKHFLGSRYAENVENEFLLTLKSRIFGHTYRARMAYLLKEVGINVPEAFGPHDRRDPCDYSPAPAVHMLEDVGKGAPGVSQSGEAGGI